MRSILGKFFFRRIYWIYVNDKTIIYRSIPWCRCLFGFVITLSRYLSPLGDLKDWDVRKVFTVESCHPLVTPRTVINKFHLSCFFRPFVVTPPWQRVVLYGEVFSGERKTKGSQPVQPSSWFYCNIGLYPGHDEVNKCDNRRILNWEDWGLHWRRWLSFTKVKS